MSAEQGSFLLLEAPASRNPPLPLASEQLFSILVICLLLLHLKGSGNDAGSTQIIQANFPNSPYICEVPFALRRRHLWVGWGSGLLLFCLHGCLNSGKWFLMQLLSIFNGQVKTAPALWKVTGCRKLSECLTHRLTQRLPSVFSFLRPEREQSTDKGGKGSQGLERLVQTWVKDCESVWMSVGLSAVRVHTAGI